MMGSLAFLVVEDDGGVRRMLTRTLAVHGEVDAVGTCAAARLALRAHRFDALFVDVQLPDGSGLDLLEPARKRNPNLCMLVMTGSTEHAIIHEAHERGARYLLKPVDGRQLMIVVEEARGRRDARARRTRLVLQRWIADYDLSPAEADLLELGAQGVPRDEFSRLRGVRPDTIRKQIQGLLHKTGDETFEGAVNSVLREAVAEPT